MFGDVGEVDGNVVDKCDFFVDAALGLVELAGLVGVCDEDVVFKDPIVEAVFAVGIDECAGAFSGVCGEDGVVVYEDVFGKSAVHPDKGAVDVLNDVMVYVDWSVVFAAVVCVHAAVWFFDLDVVVGEDEVVAWAFDGVGIGEVVVVDVEGVFVSALVGVGGLTTFGDGDTAVGEVVVDLDAVFVFVGGFDGEATGDVEVVVVDSDVFVA